MAVITIPRNQTDQAGDLFVSPKQQIENVRDWSDLRSWGFTEHDFARAKAQLAGITCPVSYLNALVLVPHLGTIQRTFEELWLVAAFQQTKRWRSGWVRSDNQHLRLRPGITHRPGLRWEVISLAANPGELPADISTRMAAHAGVLAAAAHFPKWVQVMNGDTVPYVWMAGYQCSDSIREPWRAVPHLMSSGSPPRLYLATGADDDLSASLWAVPVRWER